jgi:hypothetical protein
VAEPSGEAFASDLPDFSAHDLPCVEIRQSFATDALTVIYASDSIYRRGAVFPKMEGLACLDVLTDWLSSSPQSAWYITVGGEFDTDFDPQSLANKRQELLQRYFLRKGIDTSKWKWQSMPRRRMQLKLDELKDSP